MKYEKTIEQLFNEFRSKPEGYGSVRDIFEAGHASRDHEVDEKDKLLEQYKNYAYQDKIERGDINAKLIAANQRIENLRRALKFYSNKKDWHQCIASSDVSESIQDGDFFYAFDQGEDCPWWTALETLQDDKGGV